MGTVAVETRSSLADAAGVVMSPMMSITAIEQVERITANRLHNALPFCNSLSKHTPAVSPLSW